MEQLPGRNLSLLGLMAVQLAIFTHQLLYLSYCTSSSAKVWAKNVQRDLRYGRYLKEHPLSVFPAPTDLYTVDAT